MTSLRFGQISLIEEHWVPPLVLLLALIHGLLYVFLVPPWQHYDEPGHFEFAWLIANREGLPARGQYDQAMRRELAASMIENDFFEGLGFRPNLLSQGQPIWIGISQITSRPAYHFLISLPLRLVPASDIAFQLYLGRLVSLLLYLVTIAAAFGVLRELTPPRHPLRWMVPASLALLPGFTDVMAAINDDVGATAFFSLFLLASVRLIYRGFSWLGLAALLATAALCFWTKNTVTMVLLLIAVPLLFSALRGSRQWMAWAALAVGAAVLVQVVFGWGDAAKWYRQTTIDLPTRSRQEESPHGRYAFRIPLRPENPPPRLVQVFPGAMIRELQGKTVSLGAWIWADKPVSVRTPILYDRQRQHYQEVEIGTEPAFFAFTASVSEVADRLQLILAPVAGSVTETLNVYYDGVVLVEGLWPPEETPEFLDPNGYNGRWAGESFQNLVRNASAESPWPRVHPRVDNLITANFPGRPSLVLAALLDWSPPAWYYRATGINLAQTFWAKFGWGHVPLVGYYQYTILGLVTLAGAGGAGLALWRRRVTLPWEIILLFGVALVWIWGAALMRGINGIVADFVFIPSARYAYPAIIPTMLFLNLGWLELIRLANRYMRVSREILFALYLLFFALLDVLAVVTILRFYGS